MSKLRVVGRNDEGGPGRACEPVALRDLEERLVHDLEEGGESGAIDAVNTALACAVHHRATDVHVEPWHDCLALRFRIDGLLHDVAQIPKPHQPKVIARIKILAKIVVYQREMPQDGRIEPDATPCGKAMRVSTFPTVNGEKTVVRVMNPEPELLALDALGFQSAVAEALREFCQRPQGTLLLTGPSSSGKTTTIYALLEELMKSRESTPHIVTVEDPVEYRLKRIAQTEVKPHAGFTFEAALRALLRQDPEVIMVGEIRDVETARTAIQAGLTGHLVISTIHSGTAAGVFTRLLDMGVEPFLIASSVTGVLAQRLVRVVCPSCAAPYEPGTELRSRFGLETGVRLVRGAGCEACQGIGYVGRSGLSELLAVDDSIAERVLKRPRTAELHEAAVSGGMATLTDDGVARAKEGGTTLEELKRVLPTEKARSET